MTGSVRDLLNRIGTQVEQLCNERGLDPDWPALERAWAPLARATLRALDTLNTAHHGIRHAHALEAALHHTLPVRPIGPPLLTHWKHSQLAETVGALADLLTTAPLPRQPVTNHAAEQVATALAGNITNAAIASLRRIPTTEAHTRIARHLRRIATATPTPRTIEPNYLLGWKFPSAHEPGIDGALQDWAARAVEVLGSPMNVTGLALQLIASDIALLSAAASDLLVAHHDDASEHSISAAQLARGASHAWTKAASWPPHVRLGGRTPDLRQTSTGLRKLVDPLLRTQDPVTLAGHREEAAALATRTLSVAVDVAKAHVACLQQLASGVPALWMDTSTIPVSYLNTLDQLTHRADWRPAPKHLNAGTPLYQAGLGALSALERAFDATLTSASHGAAHSTVRWEVAPSRSIGIPPDPPRLTADPPRPAISF